MQRACPERPLEKPGAALTGHDLNDGALIISPLANGGRLLGGIDTGITYGFEPAAGAPDRGRQMTEAEIYAGTAQALGVSGRCHAAGHARDASERLRPNPHRSIHISVRMHSKTGLDYPGN